MRQRHGANGEFAESQPAAAASGMEPAGGGLPGQWADSSAVVPGTWDRGIHLFLLAKKGVSGLEGSPGDNLRRGAGSGVFPALWARGSVSGSQRHTDPGLRGSG